MSLFVNIHSDRWLHKPVLPSQQNENNGPSSSYQASPASPSSSRPLFPFLSSLVIVGNKMAAYKKHLVPLDNDSL